MVIIYMYRPLKHCCQKLVLWFYDIFFWACPWSFQDFPLSESHAQFWQCLPLWLTCRLLHLLSHYSHSPKQTASDFGLDCPQQKCSQNVVLSCEKVCLFLPFPGTASAHACVTQTLFFSSINSGRNVDVQYMGTVGINSTFRILFCQEKKNSCVTAVSAYCMP